MGLKGLRMMFTYRSFFSRTHFLEFEIKNLIDYESKWCYAKKVSYALIILLHGVYFYIWFWLKVPFDKVESYTNQIKGQDRRIKQPGATYCWTKIDRHKPIDPTGATDKRVSCPILGQGNSTTSPLQNTPTTPMVNLAPLAQNDPPVETPLNPETTLPNPTHNVRVTLITSK